MSFIAPNTNIRFLTGIPFDPNYENTMFFASKQEQTEYFTARTTIELSNYSYQRKGKGIIRAGRAPFMEASREVISWYYNINYMMYKNTSFEDKWFYAFVDRVEYVNNETVDIYYTIDVVQSWFFEMQFNQCFIERQHTITDNLGDNTIPEGLETGPYIESLESTFNYTPAICLVTTFNSNLEYAPGSMIHGRIGRGDMFSGLYYFIWRADNQENIDAINSTLKIISGNAHLIVTEDGDIKLAKDMSDGVVALFMLPWEFANAFSASVQPQTITAEITNQQGVYAIGSYLPRNKKLLCYPYNMLYVDNNQGETAEYKWEDFAGPTNVTLAVWGNVATNPGLMLWPKNYKGVSDNYDEVLTLTGFPMCSWAYDSFKAWLAQNAGTLLATGAALGSRWMDAIRGNVASMGLANSINSAFGASTSTAIAPIEAPNALVPGGKQQGVNPVSPYLGGVSDNLLGATMVAAGQVYDHSRKPPQSKGSGNGSLVYQAGLMTFYVYKKFIKPEYAKIIDAFFDMYGYKINLVGTPILNARNCYTYIKTVGCSIHGHIPADDTKIIEALFDRGIRFWKTNAEFGNYNPTINPNYVGVEG